MLLNFNKKITKNFASSFSQIKDDAYNFEWIGKYFARKDKSQAFQVISDKTCNDLDFEELFMFLDRTTSKVGQQVLYNKLRIISPTKSFDGEKLIALFSGNDEFRIGIQKQLQKLKSDDAYFITTLFQDDHVKPPKWFFIVPILSCTSLFSLAFLAFNLNFFLVLFAVFLINLGIHFWNKRNLYQYLGSLPQLLKLTKVASELYSQKDLRCINPDLPKSLRIMNSLKKRMFFFNFSAKLEDDYAALVHGVIEIIKIVFVLEPLLLFGALKRLESNRTEIEDLFTFVGEVDSLISIASVRAGLTYYCLPNIIDDKKSIYTEDIYHPLIHNCVSNTIEINNKSVLLTGSNMSGKTSFIRTIGINVICALTINTCFARTVSLTQMRVYSAIRISDDLLNNKSYYFEEVLTVKEMIEQGRTHSTCLFLLDEIFKGTNTVERISAGKAVLSSLAKNNMVFVSTHDVELADLLQLEYKLFHFSEQVEDKNVDFDYKLKGGKLRNKNAIRILEINNYPKDIIDEAISISDEIEMGKAEKN